MEIESRAEKREDRAKGQDRITRQHGRGRQKEQKHKIELNNNNNKTYLLIRNS